MINDLPETATFGELITIIINNELYHWMFVESKTRQFFLKVALGMNLFTYCSSEWLIDMATVFTGSITIFIYENRYAKQKDKNTYEPI